MAKVKPTSLEHGGERWGIAYFESVTEEQAVRSLPMKNHNVVRNVWKQINGKSIPNYAKADEEVEEVVEAKKDVKKK